jgi:hypothetical protein
MTEWELQTGRRELERVAGEPRFCPKDRLARFLRFVARKHLEGRDDEIKVSVPAVEVFGRSPDHNSKQDSIVRTEASRLRARLSEYYQAEGKDDPRLSNYRRPGEVARSRSRQRGRLRRREAGQLYLHASIY